MSEREGKPQSFDNQEAARRHVEKQRVFRDRMGDDGKTATAREVQRFISELDLSDQDWRLLFAAAWLLSTQTGTADTIKVVHALISDVGGEG